MAQRLSMMSEFPVIRIAQSRTAQLEPAVESEPCECILNPWYNDLSHDITDSTVFRLLLIVVVFDYIWRWLNG